MNTREVFIWLNETCNWGAAYELFMQSLGQLYLYEGYEEHCYAQGTSDPIPDRTEGLAIQRAELRGIWQYVIAHKDAQYLHEIYTAAIYRMISEGLRQLLLDRKCSFETEWSGPEPEELPALTRTIERIIDADVLKAIL